MDGQALIVNHETRVGPLLRAKERLLVIQWPGRYRKHRSGHLSESGVVVALFFFFVYHLYRGRTRYTRLHIKLGETHPHYTTSRSGPE
jgi:hypothetical protein